MNRPPPSNKSNNNDNNNNSENDVGKPVEISEKEQTRRDWDIVKKLLPNVWPRNDWGTKTRVSLAISLLIGGKVCYLITVYRRRKRKLTGSHGEGI